MEFRKRGFSGTLDPEPTRREAEHQVSEKHRRHKGKRKLACEGMPPYYALLPKCLSFQKTVAFLGNGNDSVIS